MKKQIPEEYIKFDNVFVEGVFVEPPKDHRRFRAREAYLETKRIGRPLTEKEMEKYYVE